MEPRHPPRREKYLLLLLLLTLVLPLLLTTLVHFTAEGPGLVGKLRRDILEAASGTVTPLTLPTLADLKTARYQEELATRFNEGYAGHDWVRRFAQEASLRLTNTVQGGIVLGRHHSTYFNDKPYEFVDEYAVERPTADSLDYIMRGLRLWRDSCRDRGVGFAIVITPSKASVYPEDLPAAWQRRHDPRPRAYDNFVRLLQQEHIRYLDGHLLTLEAKAHAPSPVFPLGGTHWNQFAALQTANALLRELASQGQPLRPIENTHIWVENNPAHEDADMLVLMQALLPWSYPVTRITYPPVPLEPGKRPNLVIIGGSFVASMGLHLYRSEQFSEIHWLRYYNVAKELPNWNAFLAWQILKKPFEDLDVEKEVYPAQNLVLEVNEQYLVNPLHLRRFFDETMARLPAPGAPKFCFPYEGYLPVRWNEPLRFMAGGLPGLPGVFSGFARPEAGGCWSDGSDSTLCVTVPSLDQDVRLSLVAGAFSASNQIFAQRVTLFANEHPVTEWFHAGPEPQTDQAVIPRALLGDGRVVLRFHYSHAGAPADYNPALRDTRKLALFFGSLTLGQPYRRVDGPVIPAAVTMLDDPVYARHFTGAGPTGLWTEGPSATLRLPVPPGSAGEVTLSAEVDALIDEKKLPVQRTELRVNGQPVGEWVFLNAGTVRREVTIPRALFQGQDQGKTLEVELHFSRTISPAELSGATDPRQLALLFKSVQLHWGVRDAEHPAWPGSDEPDDRSPGSFLSCHWDAPLSFAAGARPEQPGALSGLFPAEPGGSWSDGPDTTMCLRVPDTRQDVLLSALTGATGPPGQRPIQRVQVFANGQPVTEWVYDVGAAQRDEALIPRALLGDGRIVLRFHYARTSAAADADPTRDARRLAVLFDHLTLRQSTPRVDGPVISAADPAVYADHFSGVESGGRWTDGPGATLRFPMPPADEGSVALTAEVGALLDPARLPTQRASIFVRGQPVGEWRFTTSDTRTLSVDIPRVLLHGETLEIEFRFSGTVVPAEITASDDHRQLALQFKRVQLHWSALRASPALPPG